MAIAKGNALKFVYVPTGKSLPDTRDDSTIYFDEGNKQLYVGSNLIASVYQSFASDIAAWEVKKVTISGTGNCITGATFTNGTLTLTKGNFPTLSKGTDTSGTISSTSKKVVTGVNVSGHQITLEKSDLPDTAFSDTTYSFTNGTDGSFNVTPSGGSAQKVTIGKPSTAGTADKVAKALSVTVGSADAVTFDGSTAKSVEITPTTIGAVASVQGENAIAIDSTSTTSPKVKLKLDSSGNVSLSQSASGLKASVTIPAATVTGVKSGEKVLALSGTELTSTLSLDYDSANKKIQLKGISGQVVADLDATAFIKDGMVDSVAFAPETKTLTITFNTDSGKEAIDVDLTSLVDTYTAGNGIDITGNKVSAKVDSTSESFLSVGEGGIKLSGVNRAIGQAISQLDAPGEYADITACEVISGVSETNGKISVTKETLPTFTKGEGATAGKVGLVPAPTAAESSDSTGKYLKADGTWAIPTDTKVKLTEVSGGAPVYLAGTAGTAPSGSVIQEMHVTSRARLVTGSGSSTKDTLENVDLKGNADTASTADKVGHQLSINGVKFDGSQGTTVPTATTVTGSNSLVTDKAVKDYVDSQLVWDVI